MVMPLRVPRRYEEGLAKLRDLTSESVDELLAALQELPPTVNEGSLSSSVASRVNTISRGDVEEIVPALLSLHSLRDVTESPASEIATRVAQGMEESGSNLLKLSPEERTSFESRLVEFLHLDSLDIAVRAGTLLLEQEHSLRQARVLTDIRPVFQPDNPKAPPRAAVIVHTLKISYFDDNELKEFFVALDNSDVRALSEQLERADLKTESLKSVLAAAKVPYMDAE